MRTSQTATFEIKVMDKDHHFYEGKDDVLGTLRLKIGPRIVDKEGAKSRARKLAKRGPPAKRVQQDGVMKLTTGTSKAARANKKGKGKGGDGKGGCCVKGKGTNTSEDSDDDGEGQVQYESNREGAREW